MSNKRDLSNLHPVFRLKPNRTDGEYEECEIKFIDYIGPTDKLGDEPIEINTSEAEIKALGPNTHFLGNINGYDITVNVYRNNITGSYLVNNKNLPVCSLQFMYAKNIVVGYLFNIFIYFCLDPVKNTFLKTAKSFINSKIYGKYVMILDSDKELLDDMNSSFTEKIQEYAMEDVALRMTDNINDEQLLELIQRDIEEKKVFYKNLAEGIEIKYSKNIKKFAEDNLIPLYKSPHINGLVKFALDSRAKKRVKEYNAFQGEYKIPQKVLKLTDIQNNPDIVDEFIGLDED